MKEVYTKNEGETAACAQELAKRLEAGSFVALDGELGSGKTAFVKGLAQGLGVRERVISPTFTLLRAYESGNLPLYHYDAYRISSKEELVDIGFYDYATADGVCVCEWASLIESELPEARISVIIERVPDNEYARRISINGAE